MTLSRRILLAAGAAGGVATVGLAAQAAGLGNPDNPPQGRDAAACSPAGASIPGPQSPAMANQFPSSLLPPSTDAGEVANFRFSFNEANSRVQHGGWARQVTQRELSIANTIAAAHVIGHPARKPTLWGR